MGLLIIICSLVIGIVNLKKFGGVVNILAIIISIIMIIMYIIFAVMAYNSSTNIVDSARVSAVEDNMYSIIDQVENYYQTNSENQNLTTPYVVTFNNNGNDKNITFRSLSVIPISGTVTVDSSGTGTCQNVIAEYNNQEYLCNSNNYSVECEISK